MMDHLGTAKEILENVGPGPDGPVAEWLLEAQAHALIALVERLDTLVETGGVLQRMDASLHDIGRCSETALGYWFDAMVEADAKRR